MYNIAYDMLYLPAVEAPIYSMGLSVAKHLLESMGEAPVLYTEAPMSSSVYNVKWRSGLPIVKTFLTD